MDFCKGCGMLKKNCRCDSDKFKKTTDTYSNKENPKKKLKKKGSKATKKATSTATSKSRKKVTSKSTKKTTSKATSKTSKETTSKATKGTTSKLKKEKDSKAKNKDISKSTKEKNSQKHLDKLKTKYPNIDLKIIENFPFEKPREGQFETISEISKAIDEGYKYIVLEAGTGTGKSVIAATLAKIYSPAFILTMTKQLQDQYLEDFESEGFKLVKGRNNFECKEKELYSDEKWVTCDKGTCTERYNFRCNFKLLNIEEGRKTNLEHAYDDMYWKSSIHCNFLEQKVEGIKSSVVIANYDYAMLELNYVGDFKKRNLLILDEAHNLERKIMRFIELEIDRKKVENEIKVKVTDDEIKNLHNVGHEAWISFVKSLINRYKKQAIKYDGKLKLSDENNVKVEKKLEYEKTLKGLKDELEDYQRFISYMEEDSGNWIMEDNEDFIYFKPLEIDKYAREYLFRFGEICLFMSATILDYKNFAKWLGLREKDVKFIQVDTPFKPNLRPIDLTKSIDMNYQKLSRNAPKTIDFIKEILEKHKNEKGIIHTVSYQCSKFLDKNMFNPRLITHDSTNRMKVLNNFEKSKKPLVLLSPSMNEGVDLPYDLCRFQIIYKIPFPPVKDKQVSKRTKKDINWYPYQTMMNLVQTYGRGMRAEDDYCQTYIIDNRLRHFIEKRPLYRRLVPKFFKEAIIGFED